MKTSPSIPNFLAPLQRNWKCMSEQNVCSSDYACLLRNVKKENIFFIQNFIELDCLRSQIFNACAQTKIAMLSLSRIF